MSGEKVGQTADSEDPEAILEHLRQQTGVEWRQDDSQPTFVVDTIEGPAFALDAETIIARADAAEARLDRLGPELYRAVLEGRADFDGNPVDARLEQ